MYSRTLQANCSLELEHPHEQFTHVVNLNIDISIELLETHSSEICRLK